MDCVVWCCVFCISWVLLVDWGCFVGDYDVFGFGDCYE